MDNIKLVDGALKGYIDALGDPYTTYLTKEEMEELLRTVQSGRLKDYMEELWKVPDIDL